jgi:hypothetical protein
MVILACLFTPFAGGRLWVAGRLAFPVCLLAESTVDSEIRPFLPFVLAGDGGISTARSVCHSTLGVFFSGGLDGQTATPPF